MCSSSVITRPCGPFGSCAGVACSSCRYQLEQQAAELAKEVTRLRTESEQEMFVTESAGALALLGVWIARGRAWLAADHLDSSHALQLAASVAALLKVPAPCVAKGSPLRSFCLYSTDVATVRSVLQRLQS